MTTKPHIPCTRAFGYMRVFCDVTDDRVRQMERRMRNFAEMSGLQMPSIFHEVVNGSHEAFYEMGEALRRADTHIVVLPSLRHLSTHDPLREVLLNRLEFEFLAEVHTLKHSAPHPAQGVMNRRSVRSGHYSHSPSASER
ncbi:hypothetical protein QFZ75_006342 [Streptomyces sp. V3I8]|nr:hypothetical protein [Streptomyces sp. V3I8]